MAEIITPEYIKVDGKDFKVLKTIEVLWSGWDCDGEAWLVNDNEKNKLVVSSHGQKYFSDKNFLENRIIDYETAIKESLELIQMLN